MSPEHQALYEAIERTGDTVVVVLILLCGISAVYLIHLAATVLHPLRGGAKEGNDQ